MIVATVMRALSVVGTALFLLAYFGGWVVAVAWLFAGDFGGLFVMLCLSALWPFVYELTGGYKPRNLP